MTGIPTDNPPDRGEWSCKNWLAVKNPPKILRKISRRLITTLGQFLKTLQADSLEIPADGGVQLSGRHRFLRNNMLDGVDRRRRLKWRSTCQQTVERGPQRVDIRRRTDLIQPALRLFRWHVAWGPHDLAGRGPLLIGGNALGQTEVSDLRGSQREKAFDPTRAVRWRAARSPV